jgi:hypothetical protein
MPLRPHDQRRVRRRPLRRAAKVIFGSGGRSLPCVIWDISEGGGRLAVAYPTADLPRSFTLLLSKDSTAARRCEVVWIDRRFVGVKFV